MEGTNLKKTQIKKALLQWCSEKAQSLSIGSQFVDHKYIMTELVLKRLMRWGWIMENIKAMKQEVARHWGFFDEYGAEVLAIIQELKTPSKKQKAGQLLSERSAKCCWHCSAVTNVVCCKTSKAS
jgi:hypothetical protein